MDVLKEDYDERAVYVKTDNRSKPFKVSVPKHRNVSMWEITYEDGTKPSFDGLKGFFTSKRDALRALESFEQTVKMSKKEYQMEVMNLPEIPALPPTTKKPRGRRKKVATTSTATDG